MRKISLVFLTVLMLAEILSITVFSQTVAIVIKPTAKLFKEPNARLRTFQTIKRGQKLKLRSIESNRGWYQVSIISEKDPLSSKAAYNAYLDSFLTYWISGRDIKIQADTTDSNNLETPVTNSEIKNDWIKYGSSDGSIYFYNPARTTKSRMFVQAWVEERDESDNQLLSKILYEINCNSNNLRSLAGIKYHPSYLQYPDGRRVKQATKPTTSNWNTPNAKFTVIFPDSIGESLSQTICKK